MPRTPMIAPKLAAAAIVLMTALSLCACGNTASTLEPPQAPQPEVAALPCHNVQAAVWEQGIELRQYFTDHHGHDVEVWCYRGVFRAHWDVRVGWDASHAQGPVHHSATIGGCFFENGQSAGPFIKQDANHEFTTVEWTNQDPAHAHKKYNFSYDFGTGKLAVTATAPGMPPVTKIIAAQATWDDLENALPMPPD
jgi:hypothetical protein